MKAIDFKAMNKEEATDLIESLVNMATTELVNFYNAYTPKPIKKFHTRTKGIAQITKMIHKLSATETPAAATPKKEKAAPKKERGSIHKELLVMNSKKEKAAPKKEKAAPHKKRDLPGDETKIELLVEENPKRKGTKSWDKFELYTKYPTIGEYFDNGGKRDILVWDKAHGFINY